MKFRSSATALVFSIVLLAPHSVIKPFVAPERVHINLATEFSDDNMADQINLLDNLIKSPGVKEVDLFISSPGGDTDTEATIVAQLNTLRSRGVIIKSFSGDWVASAAADVFMEGDVRVMNMDDQIVFHEESMEFDNDMSLTVSEIREIVQTGRLSHCSDGGTLEYMQSDNGKAWIANHMSEMQGDLPGMEAEELKFDTELAARMGKPIPWIKKYMTRPFHDTFFYGSQAFVLGIATVLTDY